MNERPEIWLVAREEELIAELVLERHDGLWLTGTVTRREGFAALEPLFAREARLAAASSSITGWWRAYRELRAQIRLIRPDGHEVPEFILRVDRGQARWRCIEPISEDSFDAPAPWLQQRVYKALRDTVVPAIRSTVALTVTALLILSAWADSGLAGGPVRHRSSDNWAGYADTASRPLATVSGSWTQPGATCDQPGATYSAFWVGLGGFKKGSHELEQIGTEADCTGTGAQRVFSWLEILPSPPVRLSLGVHRGDRITARGTVRGHQVRLRIANLTTRRSVTRTVRMAAPDTSSAEWIAEAPSACVSASQCHVLPLTNFGTVSFAGATAGLAGEREATITAAGRTTTAITLTGGAPEIGPMPAAVPADTGLAVPSPLSDGGSSFTITVRQRPQPQGPPPPPLAAPDRLRHAPSPASGPAALSRGRVQ
jgi:Peptidase A4 family